MFLAWQLDEMWMMFSVHKFGSAAWHPWRWLFGNVQTQQRKPCTVSDKILTETGSITTELWASPVGWLPSCVGTLPRELRECAADAWATGVAGAAAHVEHTGLDVMLRVDLLAARAPGLWAKQLVTGALLQVKRRKKKEKVTLRRFKLLKTF